MCNLGVTIAMGLLCWGELSAETAAVVQPEAKAHLSPVVWHSYGKWSILYRWYRWYIDDIDYIYDIDDI